MICQKCKRRLKADATSCLCGWNSAQVSQQTTAYCAHQDCVIPALVRVKTETGFANLCMKHYEAYWTPQRVQTHGINRGEKDNALMAEIRAAMKAKGEIKGEASEFIEATAEIRG
jgi:hypothetical protein